MTLHITTLLTCGLSLLLIVLSWRVIAQRRVSGSSLGDGGDPALTRRIRAQGNLVEYAPLFVVLVGLGEIQSGGSLTLAAIAMLFFLGRLAHGYALAFSENFPPGRFWGTVATYLAYLLAVIFNLVSIL